MPIWEIKCSARPDDPRWLGQPIWSEVVVRAATAAQARLAAERMQREETDVPRSVGNESLGFHSAFEDEKMYVVRPIPHEAAADWQEDGPEEVLLAARLFV